MIEKFSINEFVQEMADALYLEQNITSIYQELHRFQDGYYKPLNRLEVRNIVANACKGVLPNEYLSKAVIEKVIFFMEIKQIISAEKVNPVDCFPVANGELRFINGKVVLSQESSVFTFRSNISFDDKASVKSAVEFLRQVLPSEADHNRILESLAIALFPVLRETVNFDSFILCYGTGANGKSVFFDSLASEIFGKDAVSRVQLEEFNKRFALAGLLGKRLNVSTENNISRITENAQLKALTSGDCQTVERKHKDAFPAKLIAVPIFSVNKEPSISDVSFAMERRLHIIHFPNRFVDNPKLPSEFKANPQLRHSNSPIARELQQALLKLIILKAEHLYKTKQMTANDKALIANLQMNSSHHREFIAEEYVFDAQSTIESEDLFQSYLTWCQGHGIYDASNNGNVAWTHPDDRYDKATKTKDRLTKKLRELFDDKLCSVRISSVTRGLKGLRKKKDAPKIKRVDHVAENPLTFSFSETDQIHLKTLGWTNDLLNKALEDNHQAAECVLNHSTAEKICFKTKGNLFTFAYKDKLIKG